MSLELPHWSSAKIEFDIFLSQNLAAGDNNFTDIIEKILNQIWCNCMLMEHGFGCISPEIYSDPVWS